jgi:hypothetical protein
MNKKLLILLAIAVVAIPMAASCGRTKVVTGVPIAPAVPHPTDVRFADCNACHAVDQIAAKPLPHVGMGYTNADCTKKGCHAASGATTTTTTMTTTTTSGTGTTTQNTTSGGATLPTQAIAITTHTAAQLASYKGLCLMCHGPGTSNSSPYPTSWNGKANGSTANTGTYTVAAGSTADHTSYTTDQCTQAGCHAAPVS